MPGLMLCFLGLWFGSAFAPGALDRQLADAAVTGRLPLAFADGISDHLVLSFHGDSAQPFALFVPAQSGQPARLSLYAPTYLRGLTLQPVEEMPIDVADGFFASLFEAYLHREVAKPGSPFAAELRKRAALTMTDVPREHRLEAYLDAQSAFVGHAITVANEMNRKDRAWSAEGRDLCAALSRPLPLFTLWAKMFSSLPYRGAYTTVVSGAPVGRMSQSALTPEDRRFIAERALHVTWHGEIVEDLGPAVCAPGG